MALCNESVFASGRAVMGEELHDLGKINDRIWVVTPDVGKAVDSFRKDFPDRFVDVGIAEQNAMGVAAGLALEGNLPFVVGMIPFLTKRCCEQVYVAVCYNNLPVRIIGTGGGLVTGGGATHNAVDGIAIMKTFVNMSVISISDPYMLKSIISQSINMPGPLYIRMGQGKKDRVIYQPGTEDFKIGKPVRVFEGDDLTIFAHGDMVRYAIDAASILRKQGINAAVIDMFTIKPLDMDAITRALEGNGKILVVEDHWMFGGLASSMADAFTQLGKYPSRFARLGVPAVYAGFGEADELRNKYGYGVQGIVDKAKELLK